VPLYPRGLQCRVERALGDVPIVVLEGLRTTGKTTLAKSLVVERQFFSLTEPATRDRAHADPRGWLESLPMGCAIDEAQLLPGLPLVAKSLVDERGGSPGQFLLTGSARISRTDLGGSDPLAGRAERVRVEPLAQCEIEGTPRDVISELFTGEPSSWPVTPLTHGDLVARFIGGGLPLVRQRSSERIADTLDEYVAALFGGEVFRTGKNVDGIVRLFRFLAASSSRIVNFQNIGKKVELSKPTIQGYLNDLQQVFLVETVDGYRADPAKRVTEKPRLFVADPAFVAAELGLQSEVALFDAEHGTFVETIVATELRRLFGWSATGRLKLMHWRASERDEVDLVIERADGKVIAIEVKAARSIGSDAARGIASFRRENPATFHRGFVLHCGDRVERLDDNVWSVPISALWTIGSPLRPAPTSLADRLAAATERIRVDRIAHATNATMQEQHLNARISNAEARFAEASPLLLEVRPTLEQLGIQTRQLQQISDKSTGVIWWNSSSVELVSEVGATKLVLEARVLDDELDRIGWLLRLVGQTNNDFGGSFNTAWNEDPRPALEERLGRFADYLPEFIKWFNGND
jgi:uncharacterized protein